MGQSAVNAPLIAPLRSVVAWSALRAVAMRGAAIRLVTRALVPSEWGPPPRVSCETRRRLVPQAWDGDLGLGRAEAAVHEPLAFWRWARRRGMAPKRDAEAPDPAGPARLRGLAENYQRSAATLPAGRRPRGRAWPSSSAAAQAAAERPGRLSLPPATRGQGGGRVGAPPVAEAVYTLRPAGAPLRGLCALGGGVGCGRCAFGLCGRRPTGSAPVSAPLP